MKNDFLMPIVVLSLICLFISGSSAIVFEITEPMILDAAAEREDIARHKIIPQADEFIQLEVEDLPRGVTDVYATSNDAGYIFIVVTNGYGGDLRIMCGINNEGQIIKSAVLSHTETQGLGTIVFEKKAPDYEGKDSGQAESVDAIAGSTITSNAYKRAIMDAFTAYEIVKGVR